MNVQDFLILFFSPTCRIVSVRCNTVCSFKPKSQRGKTLRNQRAPLSKKKKHNCTDLRSSCRCLGHRGLTIIIFPAAVRQRGPTAPLPLSSPLRSQRSRPSRSTLPSCHAHWSRTNHPRFPGSFPHCGRHSFPRHAIREVDKRRFCTSRMSSSRLPPSIHFSDRLLENSPFQDPISNSLFLKKLPP